MEILKQGQYVPFQVEQQVAIIHAGTKGLLDAVPLNKMREFEREYLDLLQAQHKSTMDEIKAGKYDKAQTEVLEKVARELIHKYKS